MTTTDTPADGGTPMTSTEKLEAALREMPPSDHRDAVLDLARAGRFHDFRSESATPIADLAHACMDGARLYLAGDERRGAWMLLAQRAKLGEFDATREEAEEWAASEEGQRALRMLGGGES